MSLNESAMQSHSLHPPDAVQGVGCSQQVFCNANGVCIDRHIACRCRRCIYVCPACGRYKASQCAFQIWKSFCNQDRQLSSSTWSWRLFFCTKIFAFATAASRVTRYHLAIFESDFFKSKFKNTCWTSPKPDIQRKNALVPHLNGHRISEFSQKNALYEIVVDSFNIASNRTYYFRFWR